MLSKQSGLFFWEENMAYSLNLSKLLSDLTGPKGLSALTEEFHKIRSEVDRLKSNVQPEAHKKLKAIQVRINGLRSNWEKRQGKLEKELDKTFQSVIRVAKEAESKIQSGLRGKKRTTTKKAASGRRKSTRKRARRS
ncbi:MAG: hypothetical protein C5B49_08005 [Bdellovibrio sp.]|nr:MAG: hypothetical protein C5B49_08005 [Bdellovibrio sp.]